MDSAIRLLAGRDRLQLFPPRDQCLDLGRQRAQPALCLHVGASVAEQGRVGERGLDRLALPFAGVDLPGGRIQLGALAEGELALLRLTWRWWRGRGALW